jgi:hypothetical protein
MPKRQLRAEFGPSDAAKSGHRPFFHWAGDGDGRRRELRNPLHI